MIIKSLLFIIVCIFVYESYHIMNKMTDEYFTTLEHNKQTKYTNYNNNTNNTNNTEPFVSLGTDPEQNDIAKTIAINCKAYPSKVNSIMKYKPEPDESLDTPYYVRFKPLEYNPKRQYYWRSDILIPEGKRRSKDDETEIAKVQNLLDKETNPDMQQIYEEELKLFKWRTNILANKEPVTGLDRDMRDITTDYFSEEIGMNRPWIERHSHIPNYSY